jgi:hypothetical protein
MKRDLIVSLFLVVLVLAGGAQLAMQSSSVGGLGGLSSLAGGCGNTEEPDAPYAYFYQGSQTNFVLSDPTGEISFVHSNTCNYTGFSCAYCTNLTLLAAGNGVVSLTARGCTAMADTNPTPPLPNLVYLDMRDCGMTSGDIDNIIDHLAATAPSNGVAYLTGNSPRTENSDEAVTVLEGRGWTITLDSP